MMPRWFAWGGALAALLLGSPLAAQLIGGQVKDKSTSEPVKDAIVELMTPAGRTLQRQKSDRDGFFVFELRQPGWYRLRTSRPGYQPATSDTVQVEERQTVEVEIKISTSEVQLDPLVVTARTAPAKSAGLEREGFYERERQGFGLYMTADQIAQRNAVTSTEVFRGLAGVELLPQGGNRYTVRVTRAGANCAPTMLLDGSPTSNDDLDGFVQPRDIDGIEVYRGPSEIPGRFLAYRSSCGLIVIWTKRGERNQPR